MYRKQGLLPFYHTEYRKRVMEMRVFRNYYSFRNPCMVEHFDSDGIWDFVLIALRKDQLDAALPELSSNRVTPLFVSMINGTDGSKALSQAVGGDRLALGFPGAGGSRLEDGTVQYRIVSKVIQQTTFGEFFGAVSGRVRAVADAVSKAGFPVALSGCMDAWQKTHVAMVSPLANGFYAKGESLSALAADKATLAMTIEAVREGMAILRSRGITPEPPRLEKVFSMPKGLLIPLLAFAFRTNWAETVIARHAHTARAEMRMLADEFIALADESGRDSGALRNLAAFA